MALIKVKAEATPAPRRSGIVDIFRGKVVDVSPTSYTIEVTGDEKKIEAITELLQHLGIIEIVRTGKAAIARSKKN